jgi:hypothetical protein
MNLRNILTIFFLGMLSVMIFFFGYRVDIKTQYKTQTTRYVADLRSATNAALEAAKRNATEGNNDVVMRLFGTQRARNDAANSFFTTLYQALNLQYDSIGQSEMQYRIPMLCLMDYDGYYIGYNSAEAGREGHFVITNINTWTDVSEDADARFIIQYYLGPECNVTVTDRTTGKSYTGTYEQTYKYFGSPLGLEMLSSRQRYQDARLELVMNNTTEVMDIYIDQYNYVANGKSGDSERALHYDFTLPTVDRANWANLMDKPSVLGFLQGPQVSDYSNFEELNIYSFSGYELEEGIEYVIMRETDGSYTYHQKECTRVNSLQIIGKYTSKKECAKRGAWPCPDCRP